MSLLLLPPPLYWHQSAIMAQQSGYLVVLVRAGCVVSFQYVNEHAPCQHVAWNMCFGQLFLGYGASLERKVALRVEHQGHGQAL